MNRMMPIILTRRKRPFQRNEADETQNKSSTASGARSVSASAQDGIRVVDHPTRPEALVVVVPETASLQSVLDALTAKRKERGTPGPNKFIFLSGRCGSDDEVKALFQATSENKNILRPEAVPVTNEPNCSVLDDSLTNIQWLGKINTQVSGPEAGKKDSDKEKFDGCIQLQEPQYTEEGPSAVKGPLSERPPYSYMAMIQFAINSKKNKMMTLKEIYTWIEDHFPYFRNVAKPGWKNSIRHNLSLHDMFIRESTPDGKISYWTIKNEANRCLTLDQVYKPAVDPAASSFPQAMQVCYQQQQKRVMADLKKATVCTTGIQSAMNRMMTSPRRPIILTRRKRPLQRNEADETQNKSSTASGARSVSASAQDGIRIVDHPTRPDTQVVVIPKTDQSVLDLRTAKVKERGTQGPNKFILLSGSSGSEDGDRQRGHTQQKRVMADPKNATVCTTERKMKPLLPRTDSYLVPIQLPLTPSLFLPSSAAALSLSTPHQTSTASNPVSRSGCKRLCIAPKVPKSESSVVVMSAPVAEVEEERMCIPFSEPCNSEQKEILRKRYERISRRKQRLVPLSNEEPVLLFPEGTFFD